MFVAPESEHNILEKTIVGEIDMTVSSAYNGYPAYGWLDPPVLPGDTDLVAYLQVKNPSAIFDTIPQIAQTIGMKADEYGDYPYRYHTALLGLYGIYEPGHFWNSDLPKLFLAVVLVVLASMTVFSYIIRGAFSISAKRKMKELGILKSIGMTSKQVQRMVFYEARQLAFLPILLSVGLGYLFSYGVLTGYSELVGDAMEHPITVSFSPWVALGSMVLSFLTVLLAASGPAKQVGKFRPIEAVKESWNLTTLKKSKKHTLLKKWFGFIGKLSANSIAANRKLFRTCTATLCLCMVLIFSFLAVFTISDVNNTKAEKDNHFDVNITMEPGQQVDQALIQELKALPHVTNEATYTMANCAIWVSADGLSADFVTSGGFGTKAAGEYVVNRDGQYRIPCVLIGLEQGSYDACLAKAGVEPLENGTAIVVTLLSSLDMERFARHGLLEYGEFEVELSKNAIKNEPHSQTGIQFKNPMNEDLIHAIAQMDGVAEVLEYQTLEAEFAYNGVTKKENLAPFTPDQQALLGQYLVTGTADYATMAENHEILVLRNEYADYIYDWTFQVGDTVKFRWFDGTQEQEAEFQIAGEISDGIFEDEDGGKLYGKTGFFLVPKELMNQMMPSGFNFNSQLLIRMNGLSKEPALRKAMNDLVDNTPMVTMESLYDYYQDSEAMYQRTNLVIWGLCGFIMLFAVINLVNTLIATTLSRKHEFSVLRSVGMAKKQLQRTVQWEGILLAFWNICITVLIGTGVGYGIVRYLNAVGDDTWVWHFPTVYFAGYMIAAILLPILITAALIHLLEKKSIVQQLREID